MKTYPPTPENTDDTIDSRDVIARLEELQSEKDDLTLAVTDLDPQEEPEELAEAVTALAVWEDDNGEEYEALKVLNEEGEECSSDWRYGELLIRESYFEQAMDEMVSECYELPKDLPFWMTITYDYDALRQDYTELDFGGVAYFVR